MIGLKEGINNEINLTLYAHTSLDIFWVKQEFSELVGNDWKCYQRLLVTAQAKTAIEL